MVVDHIALHNLHNCWAGSTTSALVTCSDIAVLFYVDWILAIRYFDMPFGMSGKLRLNEG